MYLYTTILLLICCIVIIIKTQVDKKNVEKIQHKRQVLQELEQDLIVKENAYLTLGELEAEEQQRLRDIESQVKNYNNTLEQLARDGRRTMAEQLGQEEIARRNLLNEKMNKEEEALWEEYLQRKQTYEDLLGPIKAELAEYQAKKEATIEAMKREQELQDNLNFHRICLKEADIEDIAYLNSILNKLSNKTAIAKVIYDVYIAGPAKEMLTRVVGSTTKSGIYRITDVNTQECYVGQSTDLKARLTQHIRGSLGIQTIADQRIHHAMAERGIQNWTFEILETCDKKDLNNREKYWINYYKSNEFGFNNTKGNK